MSTPPHALQLSSSNNNNRSLTSGGSYSQTLDQLLSFGARPPVPASRRLPEMTSNGTPPTRNGSGSLGFPERPTTRHGRSSSSNATSSSSSSKHKENGHSKQSADSSEHYTTSKLSEISSFQKRPVLSPVQSSSGATTSLNVWSREEDNHNETDDLLDDNKSNQTTSRHSNQSDEDDDDDEVDEFTKKLQSLANRTMQARNSLVASSNESQTLLHNKKHSVIMEKGETSQASSISSTGAFSSPKLNGKNIGINQASDDEGASERMRRRSSALLVNSVTQESFIEPNATQKSLVMNGSESTAKQAVASSVRRLSQPKIRSSSANTAKEKPTTKGKPWGSNIYGKDQRSNKRSTNSLSRPISTTIASLSGAFPSQLEGGSQRAISTTSSSYDAWLKHKIEENKKKKLAMKEKQEEEERKKREKKMDAEKSFQRWKEERNKKINEERAKLRQKQEEKLEQERIAKEDKKANAEKTFEYWKKSQLEQLKRHKSQSALDLKKKNSQKSREEEVKKKEAEYAYKEWLKESVKKVSIKAQKVMESEKEQEEMIKKEKEYKDELAQEAYRLWLEMKKEEENYAHSLAYKILEYETEAKKRWPSTPWLPNGNTVPRRFIGQGNRRKTIEKPLVLKYSAKRTQSVH